MLSVEPKTLSEACFQRKLKSLKGRGALNSCGVPWSGNGGNIRGMSTMYMFKLLSLQHAVLNIFSTPRQKFQKGDLKRACDTAREGRKGEYGCYNTVHLSYETTHTSYLSSYRTSLGHYRRLE